MCSSPLKLTESRPTHPLSKLINRSATSLILLALGRFVATAQTNQPLASTHGPLYKFVNQTSGKFADGECFWSLDNGKSWYSFAAEPTVPCPLGNGRVYFRLGSAPKDFGDRTTLWDFIEYASPDAQTWHGNTTQVDAFCIPITIEMGKVKIGITESRESLWAAFKQAAPSVFQSCLQGDQWIVSPCRADFGASGSQAHYFDAYIKEIWKQYAIEKNTPSGLWIGKVVEGALSFTPVAGGNALTCERPPTSEEAFLGSGVLAQNPQFCAAINRHVLADPAEWHHVAAFYQVEPCNWYAKFLHEHSIDHKAYGFCYDDVAEQAAFFSGKGSEVIVTLSWNAPKATQP